MNNSEITSLIVSCAKAHRSALNGKLRELGLFIGQDILLAHIAEVGPVSQKALADALQVEQATISESVKKLGAVGVIERQPDPNDKRAYRVVATPKGVAVAQDIETAWAKEEAKFVKNMSDAEIQSLKDILQKALARIT